MYYGNLVTPREIEPWKTWKFEVNIICIYIYDSIYRWLNLSRIVFFFNPSRIPAEKNLWEIPSWKHGPILLLGCYRANSATPEPPKVMWSSSPGYKGTGVVQHFGGFFPSVIKILHQKWTSTRQSMENIIHKCRFEWDISYKWRGFDTF